MDEKIDPQLTLARETSLILYWHRPDWQSCYEIVLFTIMIMFLNNKGASSSPWKGYQDSRRKKLPIVATEDNCIL